MRFTSLLAATVATFLCLADAVPAPENGVGLMTLEEMKAWVSSMPPEDVTIIGDPFGALTPRSADLVTVTFCSTVSGNVCTGPCTVVTGTGVCIAAPNTNCLGATGNVIFCAPSGCAQPCNGLSTCGVRLTNNFCATPNTHSIGIPAGS